MNSQDEGGSAVDYEIEVILKKDFYELVLQGMGLKKYINVPEEIKKLDSLLESIGALTFHVKS